MRSLTLVLALTLALVLAAVVAMVRRKRVTNTTPSSYVFANPYTTLEDTLAACGQFASKYRLVLPDYGPVKSVNIHKFTWVDLAACGAAAYKLQEDAQEENVANFGGSADSRRDVRNEAHAIQLMLRDMPTETCLQAYTAATVFVATNLKKYEADAKSVPERMEESGKEVGEAGGKAYEAYDTFVKSIKTLREDFALSGGKSYKAREWKDVGVEWIGEPLAGVGTQEFRTQQYVLKEMKGWDVAKSLGENSISLYNAIASGKSQDIIKSSIGFATAAIGAVSYASQGAAAGTMLATAGEFAALANPVLTAIAMANTGLQLARVVDDQIYNSCTCDFPYKVDAPPVAGLVSVTKYCFKNKTCAEEFGPNWSRTGDPGAGLCKRNCPHKTWDGACDCRKTFGKCYAQRQEMGNCNKLGSLQLWMDGITSECKNKQDQRMTRSKEYTNPIHTGDGGTNAQLVIEPWIRTKWDVARIGFAGGITGLAVAGLHDAYAKAARSDAPPLSCAWQTKACQIGQIDTCADFYNMSVLKTYNTWAKNDGLGKTLV